MSMDLSLILIYLEKKSEYLLYLPFSIPFYFSKVWWGSLQMFSNFLSCKYKLLFIYFILFHLTMWAYVLEIFLYQHMEIYLYFIPLPT